MNKKTQPDYLYRLPLDREIDRDIIDWLGSFPNKRKAEAVRYALRFYIGQLKDHELFKLSHDSSDNVSSAYKTTEKMKKKPKIGLLNNLK